MKEECCNEKMFMGAAFLIALGIVIGAYLLSTVDYAPKLNVSDITSSPNVYVSSNPPEHLLQVSGVATQSTTPDLLKIQLTVETKDKIAKTSQENNAEISDQVIRKLKDLGFSDADVKTISYSVDPIYESERECDVYGCNYIWKIKGYKTLHRLEVRITDLDKGGEVIDSVSAFGENEVFVDSVYFTLQEETRMNLQKELLKQAGMEAEAKARAIAEGVGATLGKVVRASESVYYPVNAYRSYDYAMEAGSAPAPTKLASGEVEVSATVSVGYELN
ncbi:SIMPL domain-containing protein [Candidatus Micrarchaeota archaeon]|nr:SIMPL domain-containing protein [Candidatus Micrarchaeota archaeon]